MDGSGAEGRADRARRDIEALAARFVETAAGALRASLDRAVERFVGDHADRFNGFDAETVEAFRGAVRNAIARSAESIGERLLDPDLWMSPVVVGDRGIGLEGAGWGSGVPGFVRRLFPVRRDRAAGPAESLDDHHNRVWVVLSNAADPLDPVLEEFGFDPPEGPADPGGAHFGLQPQSVRDLDPSGEVARIWEAYVAAYRRLAAARADAEGEERRRAGRRWRGDG